MTEPSAASLQRHPTAWRRCYDFCVDAVAVVAAVAFAGGLYFHVTRGAGQADLARTSTTGEPLAKQVAQSSDPYRKSALPAPQPTDTNLARDPMQAQQTTERPQPATAAPAGPPQSVKGDRAGALMRELTGARPAIPWLDVQLQVEATNSPQWLGQERQNTAALAQEAAARQKLTASTTQHRQAIDEERARSAALASELETAQRAIEPRAAQSQKAVDEALQQKQAVEATIAELRQTLEQEQKKTAALMQEAEAAQAMSASAEPQRRALEEAQARAAALASELAGTRREIETQAAQSQKAVDAATKQKQAAESTIAELRQSLQQEQKKTTTLAQEVGAAREAMTASSSSQ